MLATRIEYAGTMYKESTMAQFKKTNAMRILDKAGVPYTYEEYEYDENDLDGHHVAEYLGIP